MNTYHDMEQSRGRWRLAAVVAALLVLLSLAVVLYQQARLVLLDNANEMLSQTIVTQCFAARLGELAWNTIDADGLMVCRKFYAPPDREEWKKHLHKNLL